MAFHAAYTLNLTPVITCDHPFIIITITGDPRETSHLFQRLFVCTQRFNAVAFRGTFDQHDGDENL